ncbi:MAG: hypothetical protein JRN20_07685 [Nitrososphaerota archaeon]|nr:hypothetical protein [Nitrososphaerota archaeon]MDG6924361.1 hypothetical protein [Nitrososphaerota archaeon]
MRKSVSFRSRTKVKFTNGSEITALPCGTFGNTLRGYTAHQIIMDEAAFMPQQVISEVLMPMLATTNGIVIMLSSPFDRDHIFYKCFTSPRWSKYHFPSSMNPLITREYLDEQLQLHGEKIFAQEYLAEFVDDERVYFPMPLLRANVHSCTSNPCNYCSIISDSKNLPEARRLYGGYDPGGKSDPGAFVVVERMKDNSLRVVHTKSYLANKQEENLYTNFTMAISDYHKKFGLSKLAVDSTGLGSPIVEQCKQQKLPAEGLQLTIISKEEILSNVQLLLENRRLLLPNDMTLLTNLNCITGERSAAGHFVFSHAQGTHDDLAYALALACQAANKSSTIVMMNRDEKVGSWRDALTNPG